MLQVGRLAVKIAGRDSNRTCVVVDIIDKKYVMIDGDVRRKKVNVAHLEPLSKTIDIKKGASHEEVQKAFEASNLNVRNTKAKPAKDRPRKQRKASAKEAQAETKGKSKAKPAKK